MEETPPENQPIVLLATCNSIPMPDGNDYDCSHGESGGTLLTTALSSRNITARWATWDDPTIPWSTASLIAVRSTWDYMDKLPQFLAWAHTHGPRLLHGAKAFEWNLNKIYLRDIEQQGVPIVPTQYAKDIHTLHKLLSQSTPTRLVIKPALGASGIGVELLSPPTPQTFTPSSPGPWILQPFLSSVQSEGETTIFIIGGKVTAQQSKRVAPGPSSEFRVQEEYGGTARQVPLTTEAADLALRAYKATEDVLGVKLWYARIDLLRLDGTEGDGGKGPLVVSEIEITEPQMYFDAIEGQADAFADMICEVLKEGRAV